jgi:nucleotide-binding universal stress UspA family protein
MLPIRTILHPTDFSAHSDYAFRLACSLARDHGARVIALHVLDRQVLAYPGVMMPPPPPRATAEQRAAILAQMQQIVPRDSAVPVEYLVEEGAPATAILQIAQETPCDVIVMGTHGRTGLSRLVIGSVAEQVMRSATCPVLTVKAPHQPVKPLHEDGAATAQAGAGAAR